MKKNKILSLFLIIGLTFGINGCVGDSSVNGGTGINIQPDNTNWVNYFANYPIGNSSNNTMIYQVQWNNSIPEYLALYNSFGYTSSSTNYFQKFLLTKDKLSNNTYDIINKDSSGNITTIGYIAFTNNNNSLVVLLNVASSYQNYFNKETATIQLAGKTMNSSISNGIYYSNCFKLPSKNNVAQNNGNDLCSVNLQSNNQFQITDLNTSGTNVQTQMCDSNSTWYQNPSNPFLYTLNCNTKTGTVSFDISSQPFESSNVLNFYVNSAFNGNEGTSYVSTAFSSNDLSLPDTKDSFSYINLYMKNSYYSSLSSLGNSILINNYCFNNSSTEFCVLDPVISDGFNGGAAKIIPSNSSITSKALLIGSNKLNLFIDNLGYTYYYK